MSAPHSSATLRTRGMAGVAFILLLLFCCSLCSAIIVTTPTPATTQKLIVKPVTTRIPVATITTTPTTSDLATCDETSQCLLQSEAVAAWGEGGFTQTSELPCGFSTATIAAALPKYCYRQKVSIVQTTVPMQTVSIQYTPPPYDMATATATPVPTATHTPLIVQTAATLDPGNIQ